MSGLSAFPTIETALRLSLIYVTLALFCSTVTEWLAMLLRWRALMLRAVLNDLWKGSALGEEFYSHALVKGFIYAGSRTSHLPARVFSAALIDLLIAGQPDQIRFADLTAAVNRLPSGDLRTALVALIRGSSGDPERVRNNLEAWFNDAMTCASARYKFRVHAVTGALAAVAVVVFNVDTVSIAGWHLLPQMQVAWLSRATGWLLTASAVSLGAPFWFDVLNRAVRFRSKEAPG